MKKLILFLFAVVFVIASCSKEKNGAGDGGNSRGDETEVEMTFLSPSAAATRATRAFEGDMGQIEKGTPEESKINTLDLLIFKGNKFQYRRHAAPFGPTGLTFKATLKVDAGPLTVHFISNGRALIETLIDAGTIKVDDSWETIQPLLEDSPARSFDTPAERSNLPMWGTKSGLSVAENVVTHWQGVQLLRAVAGVDVYVDSAVSNFVLEDGRLYFVPNKGWWAPTIVNYGTSYDWDKLKSESPAGMTTGTGITPNVVGPVDVGVNEKHIANKFYLYDNDTKETSFASVTRQYTRLIVGGKYGGKTYYYPIDFVKGEGTDTDPISYDPITRNWKYLFLITGVSGPGYPDPGTASKEPPVHMTTNIFNWNATNPEREHAGFDGQYYVSLAEKKISLARIAGSTRKVKFTSNANSTIILMDFTTEVNGKADVITNGIENSRFRVEKTVTDISGVGTRVTELVFTAIGPYQTDPTLAHQNGDKVTLKVGNIVFTIDINQLNRDPGDWENGGNQDVEL